MTSFEPRRPVASMGGQQAAEASLRCHRASNLGVFWAVGAGYSGAAGFIDVPIHHFLLVSFDPQHRVTSVEFRDQPGGWPDPEFVQKLAAETSCAK